MCCHSKRCISQSYSMQQGAAGHDHRRQVVNSEAYGKIRIVLHAALKNYNERKPKHCSVTCSHVPLRFRTRHTVRFFSPAKSYIFCVESWVACGFTVLGGEYDDVRCICKPIQPGYFDTWLFRQHSLFSTWLRNHETHKNEIKQIQHVIMNCVQTVWKSVTGWLFS